MLCPTTVSDMSFWCKEINLVLVSLFLIMKEKKQRKLIQKSPMMTALFWKSLPTYRMHCTHRYTHCVGCCTSPWQTHHALLTALLQETKALPSRKWKQEMSTWLPHRQRGENPCRKINFVLELPNHPSFNCCLWTPQLSFHAN